MIDVLEQTKADKLDMLKIKKTMESEYLKIDKFEDFQKVTNNDIISN